MKSLVINGTRARMRYVEVKGTGRPLVMIHGLGCASSYEFPPLAADLRGRHLIMVDLLGYGYSDRPADFGYTTADHARCIAELVDALSLSEVDLYGHSMGGSIAIEAADLLGTRVVHLVVAEGNLDSGGGSFSKGIAAQDEESYVNHRHTRTIAAAAAIGNGDWATTMTAADARAVYLGAKSLVIGTQPSWRDRLSAHPASKTFIFGEHSLPDPDAATLAHAGIAIAIVKNAGHAMALDNPAGLAAAIRLATGLAGDAKA